MIDTAMVQLIERLGSFGLVAIVLIYFLGKYERLFQHLERALNTNAQRLARIEMKLGILEDEKL